MQASYNISTQRVERRALLTGLVTIANMEEPWTMHVQKTGDPMARAFQISHHSEGGYHIEETTWYIAAMENPPYRCVDCDARGWSTCRGPCTYSRLHAPTIDEACTFLLKEPGHLERTWWCANDDDSDLQMGYFNCFT